MDDSDQDFAEVCTRLLKRVHKRPGASRQPKKAEQQEPSSQTNHGEKKRKKRTDKKDGSSGTQKPVVSAGAGYDAGDAGTSGGQRPESTGLTAKDKILHRMQQFKRASPQKMPNDKSHNVPPPPPAPVQRRADPKPHSWALRAEPQLSDEALAMLLQEELDMEVAEVRRVNLEDRGLFFCQICQRNLSHMTHNGRTQHLNRCLDESEESGPAPPPPPPSSAPGVPDCPICGKKFKSQKSRSAHLKRCSSDMGVPPVMLLQALQRQAAETPSIPPAGTGTGTATATLTDTGGTKRKGSTKSGLPGRKKPRTMTEPMDEDTMVALALSSSLLEQQREAESTAAHGSPAAVLKWKPDTGKGRGKRKKGGIPRPPPLLLVQDAEAAQARLQERVSALLLRSRTPSPPTPTLCPTGLSGCSSAAPLWHKSALLHGGCSSGSDFYTPELREFITPWQPAAADAASTSAVNTPETSPVTAPTASILPPGTQPAACSHSAAASTPGTEQALVSSQALRDLAELAEDGMTLTQYADTASGPGRGSSQASASLHLSGFIVEEPEEQADPGVRGFLPQTARTRSDDAHSRGRRARDGTGAEVEAERGSRPTVALSRLASDLGSMVNNPQLSDVQLQVDSGEVFFAHSFMVYARCPLLAEMVHEGGFGAQEEGLPAARRVLLSDVPGQAVFALLQYLYTARCSIPASLQPHVLELASRFDLQELQQLCELRGQDVESQDEDNGVANPTDQAFVELLRSMWSEGDGDHEGEDADRGSGEEPGLEEDGQADDLAAGDREACEEKVNEDELEEIYEFAATQRQKKEEEEEEGDSEEQEEKMEDDEELTKRAEPRRSSTDHVDKSIQRNPSQDYSHLFSDTWGVYEQDPCSSSSPSTSGQPHAHTAQSQKPHKASPQLSSRALLESSASGHNCSLSPPPSTATLPVPGQSPGAAPGGAAGGAAAAPGPGGAAAQLDLPDGEGSLKPDSPSPRSVCVTVSPENREPDVIVLSDSSEDMEVFHCSRSPSPPPPPLPLPGAAQYRHSYNHIKSVPEAPGPTVANAQSQSIELSPDASSPVQKRSGCDQNLGDYSPEVSWLMPSTPLPQEHSSRNISSSTQTKSSMCRTQLFPTRGSGSSSAASSLPSPAPSRHATPDSPARAPAEGSVPRLKRKESMSCSSSSDLCLKGASSCDAGAVRDAVFTVPWSHSRSLGSPSSKQDTPLHLRPGPYSSTPLHSEVQLPRVLQPRSPSPLHSNLQRQSPTSPGQEPSASESPGKAEVASFHLSPLSQPSDPASSSSSLRGLHSSQKRSDASHQSRRSEASSGSSEAEQTGRRGGSEGESGGPSKDGADEEEREEDTGGGFQQSLMEMDEPPMAFNDSWGLDACADVGPGRFSLRLEDSTRSSQQEQSLGQPAAPQAPQSPPAPDTNTHSSPELNNSLLDSKIWDSWREEDEQEEEEEEVLPLSQRLNPSAQLKTPKPSSSRRRRTLVPITPMPHYSDMDTPELKSKLNRFGVRPLPKRQMVLKLKEIHQYTHQLASSDSEDEAPCQTKPPPSTSAAAAGSRPQSCAQRAAFKEPRAPTANPGPTHSGEEDAEPLSASQGSNTSSTAASEESERSNPELCLSSGPDSDSDDGITASQVASRLQDRLNAVRAFILSDPELYSQILQYQPLVLSHFQDRLKAAGIRLGMAKLADYLDSQCITFTTAKPGQAAPGRRQGKKTSKGANAGGNSVAGRKKAVKATY